MTKIRGPCLLDPAERKDVYDSAILHLQPTGPRRTRSTLRQQSIDSPGMQKGRKRGPKAGARKKERRRLESAQRRAEILAKKREEQELTARRKLQRCKEKRREELARSRSEAASARKAARQLKRKNSELDRLKSKQRKRDRELSVEITKAMAMQWCASHDRKEAGYADRLAALRYAERWTDVTGFKSSQVAEAAIRRASVEAGFACAFATPKTLAKWKALSQISGFPALQSGRAGKVGRKEIAACFGKEAIRSVWREAEAALGDQASFTSLAMFYSSSGVHLSASSLHRWFHKEGGVQYAEVTRPRLTPENRKARLQWYKRVLEEPRDALRCYLDEKWFYISSRRRRRKLLPRSEGEPEGVGEKQRHMATSRRHAIKIMYLGVVARPRPEYNFDGKIGIWRVMQRRPLKKATTTRNFSHDTIVNAEIEKLWRTIVSEEMEVEEMQRAICERWQDDLSCDPGKLAFMYRQGTRVKYLSSSARASSVSLEKIQLRVRHLAGEMVSEDVFCNSEFMLKVMGAVGKFIRARFHWVKPEEEIILQADNAGGHGTRVAIKTYSRWLKEKCNIRLEFQPSNSPESNMLDLGVWRSLQSHVEKLHFRKRLNSEALHNTVGHAWFNALPAEVLTVIHERLYDVARASVSAGGDNVDAEKVRCVTRNRLKISENLMKN